MTSEEANNLGSDRRLKVPAHGGKGLVLGRPVEPRRSQREPRIETCRSRLGGRILGASSDRNGSVRRVGLCRTLIKPE